MTDGDDDRRHRFVGPRGRVHVPLWSRGCYYGRPASCCWLCWLRLVWVVLRRRTGL